MASFCLLKRVQTSGSVSFAAAISINAATMVRRSGADKRAQKSPCFFFYFSKSLMAASASVSELKKGRRRTPASSKPKSTSHFSFPRFKNSRFLGSISSELLFGPLFGLRQIQNFSSPNVQG
jgi:hypothetical protein